MKNNKYIIVLLCFFCIAMQSCKKDFLDTTKPENKISDADVWASPELALKVIYGCYQSLPEGHTACMMGASIDESMFSLDLVIGDAYRKGLASPGNQGGFSNSVWCWGQQSWNWGVIYKNIRNINIGIANIDKVPFHSKEDKDKATAELYFLRGYSHFLLMAQYGGIPLYDRVINLGEDYQKPRATFEETVNFIVADLDKAISLFPVADVGKVKTRADKGVAMTAKAKVLLYAASDLHNSAKNGVVTNGYAHPELVGYVSGDATARWQKAKDAAKAVIDLNRYSLHKATDDVVRNFEEVFVKRSGEDIFLRYADPDITFYDAYVGKTPYTQAPASFGGYGWSADNVLGNLVDAFEMKDGSKFDWNNSTHKANPYANRDPRLYATVLFEGTSWYNGTIIHVGQWPDLSLAPEASKTNYWMRKFSDVQKGPMAASEITKCPAWPRMRYAEVLLNYAEACIELGQDAEARTYINKIRERAGMPPVTESGAALKVRYRNERRVEFAFEDQRFFDVRRWLIGPESSEDNSGVKVTYPEKGSFNNPSFSKVIAEGGIVWANKVYFIPITTDEMNKNKALIQNPGY